MKRKSRGTFLANIYRIWHLRYIDVPDDVVGELNKASKARAKPSKYIPVVALVNGRSERTTLLPAGGGKYRMQFNAMLRKAAGADTGELVSVALSPDREPREIAVPADLSTALKQHPTARKAFQKAPPGYRRQILKWMQSVKSESARARRIEIVMDRMLERAMLRPNKRIMKKNE